MRSRVSLLCLPLVSTKGTINRGFWSLSRDRQCVISTHTEICAPHPVGALIQPCLAPPPPPLTDALASLAVGVALCGGSFPGALLSHNL